MTISPKIYCKFSFTILSIAFVIFFAAEINAISVTLADICSKILAIVFAILGCIIHRNSHARPAIISTQNYYKIVFNRQS